PPARAPDAKHLARLLADLDSDTFELRAKAFDALDELGDGILGLLQERLRQPNLALETRRRLQNLAEKHNPADLPADRLRGLRTVEVLEHLAVPAARELLESLGQGTPAATLTRAARAAAERLH